MTLLARFFHSTLGKKYIMAITGFLLFGFVIVHMLGNLQIFLGANAINEYAELLKSKPALLWSARLGLLTIAILHIVTAIQLVLRNRAARPVSYGIAKPVGASLSSRLTAVTGTLIFAFIVYHLLHFTVGVINPDFLLLRDAQDRHDVFGMMIRGFSNPLVAGVYLIAMALLCSHLRHGVSSMFQSLGLKSGAYDTLIDRIALVAAAAIFLGNCAIVIAVLAGVVK